ncbi:MAG: general secretion pathway protein GspD [Sphingobacteriales bacterium]|nr:general secretion pathway protein GspD [Sphingobacteriales bacterium]
MIRKIVFFSLILFGLVQITYAQTNDRFVELESKLTELSKTTPGLLEKVDFSVSGASIQEFLRAIAESSSLNINIDPQINLKVYNNFSDEKVINILLFLAKEYDLDIRNVGSIISIVKYKAILEPVKLKEPNIRYNAYNNLISMELREDSLLKVIKSITKLTKKNVIISSGLNSKKVSVYLEEIPLQNALEKLAFSNDIKLSKTDDNVFVFQTLQEGESNAINAKGQLKQYRSNGRQGIFMEIIKDSLGERKINMDANNIPIVEILKAVSTEANMNYFLYSDIKGNANIHVENVNINEFLSFIFKNTDYTFQNTANLYVIGDRKLEGLRTTKIIQLQYRSIETILEFIPAELKKNVELKEFKELNSILLSGSSPQIEELSSFIKEIDKVVPMVTIEVILVDVKKGNSVKTGIKAGLSDSSKTGGTFLPGVDYTLSSKAINDVLGKASSFTSVNLGKVTPSFYVGLSALENNQNVNIRSMPKLATLNGHEANLSIGSTRYYSITTQNVQGSLNPQTIVTQQFNPVQANLTINIKPVISGDEQVTLNISVNISDFIGNPPNNQPPPSSTSEFKSIVRVRNDEMIVLGGIERMERSDEGSGVPILSRIPILKWFFSERTKTKQKTVSVVFIKPTITY